MKIQNIAAASLLALAASNANATLLDLTPANSSGTINGAIFTNLPIQPAGSGVIDSFVRISTNNPTVQGYNTSTRPLSFDENNSPIFTHDLLVNQLGIVTIGGMNYWKFLLDINQTNSDPLLQLDKLQLFMGNGDNGVPGLGLASLSDDQLIYDLDAGGNNAILLDYSLQSGSGASDMFAFIKVPTLTAADLTKKITLYSLFGDNTSSNQNNDGFEEWARLSGDTSACIPTVANNFCGVTPPNPVPEPGVLALLATALLGMGFKARGKKG